MCVARMKLSPPFPPPWLVVCFRPSPLRQVWDEDREFLKGEMAVLDRNARPMAHNHKSAVRVPERVVYAFDRSVAKGKARDAEMRQNYVVDEKRELRSCHSHFAWLSVTSHQDAHATTGVAAAKREADLDKSFKTQGQWVGLQGVAARHRRQRANHLLTLFERELEADEKREIALYGFADDDPQKKKHVGEHYKARSEAADRVMRVLEEYGILTGCDVTKYLMHTLALVRQAGVSGLDKKEQERLRLEREAQKREEAAERRRKLQESIGVSKEEAEKAEAIRSLRHVRKDAETSEEDIELAAKAAQGKLAREKQKKHADAQKAAARRARRDAEDSPSKRGRKKKPPVELQYAPMRRGGDYAEASTSFKAFKAVEGEAEQATSGVRTGAYDDVPTLPALIPVPESYASGGEAPLEYIPKHMQQYHARLCERPDPTARLELSALAQDTMHAMRIGSIDVTSGKLVSHQVPFWSRPSDELRDNAPPGRGRRMYSEVFGQPMHKFFEEGLPHSVADTSRNARATTLTSSVPDLKKNPSGFSKPIEITLQSQKLKREKERLALERRRSLQAKKSAEKYAIKRKK